MLAYLRNRIQELVKKLLKEPRSGSSISYIKHTSGSISLISSWIKAYLFCFYKIKGLWLLKWLYKLEGANILYDITVNISLL